jgi:hypothetical protein
MRATAAEWFPDLCDIFQAVETSDEMGGEITTYPVLPTFVAVPCRNTEVTAPGERVIADKMVDGIATVLVLPYDQQVKMTDRIHTQGIMLEVKGVITPRSWEVTRRVICEQMA